MINRFLSSSKSLSYASRFAFSQYDLIVIGGGPAGYVATIKAGQLGLKAACVEKRGALGGTCLNVGCIPSKALLNISHKYEEANKHFKNFGINVSNVSLDWSQVQKKKGQIVTTLTGGIKGLFAKNKVDYVAGYGKLVDANTVAVDLSDGSGTKTLQTKNIMIATGSDPIAFPGLPFDEKTVISSTGALSLDSIPESLVVIGGGIIGLELGQVYRRFGTQVTVIEFLDRIVAAADAEISKAFHKVLTKQGIVIHTEHKVTKGVNHGTHAEITFEPVKGGAAQTIKASKVLVATGRRPFSDGLNAKEIGVRYDNKNRIIINEHFQTNYANIYAVGDIVAGPMLAHKAEEEAIACVEHIAGKGGHVNYNAIPSVIYTHPEVAWVGLNEEELKQRGINYRKGSFPFLANSRAKAIDDTDGIIKVLADKDTDKLLGVHIMGPNAGEMIAEAVLGMEYGASSEDIGRVCHAHPTLSEALKEACMATYDKPIHF